MKLVPFSASLPQFSRIDDPADFFAQVKENYPALATAGDFRTQPQQALYLYRITYATGQATGVVGLVEVDPAAPPTILRHEHTIAEKVTTQKNLLEWRQAAVKPVLLTYAAQADLDRWINSYCAEHPPSLEVAVDGEVHTCWAVATAPDQHVLQRLVAAIPYAYVADGHHRLACTQAYFQERGALPVRILCGLFGHTDLRVDSFHRAIYTYTAFTKEKLLGLLEPFVVIEPLAGAALPERPHTLTMYALGQWYRLRWQPAILANHTSPVELLDTDLLNRYLLNEVFDVTDIRKDERLRYFPASQGLEKLIAKVDSRTQAVGFCLYPLDVQTMMDVAEMGQVLPPKSTWFLPRLYNGMLVHRLS